ncbi:bifunctional hydroxymethylpyrimidine kinase/phosphomethylpyrimidine kinase [Ruminococcus sp. HUN007]|uniref:bifunctional hydroxymethylpyrimidine kinase/phosphomethylpyrimidine kinase n=1 Tax=Ruminococcus sp. HUN007 TaxID=1514668 RepID=UPI0005D14A93|nr:bifunctional hydroxymethylpyrimidine kinase/phosphomethylpyrimidine kinase [Ruminococcus sp. HUN007]
MKKVLTIAGSDCSGGAGIQADIKTISAHGMYAMSAITALTAQNTTGVSGIFNVTPEFVESQLESIFTDIFPDSVKTGMMSEAEIIEAAASVLKKYKAPNIVVDPVMVSTSGSRLLSDSALDAMTGHLFPLARVITPNIPEAEVLSGISISDIADMEKAARIISEKTPAAVLVKGGHSVSDATDLLLADGKVFTFSGKRIDNPNTHGTGCTLSSAIACGLADGLSVSESIERAKEYLTGAIAAGLDLGKGSGPVDHLYRIRG